MLSDPTHRHARTRGQLRPAVRSWPMGDLAGRRRRMDIALRRSAYALRHRPPRSRSHVFWCRGTGNPAALPHTAPASNVQGSPETEYDDVAANRAMVRMGSFE